MSMAKPRPQLDRGELQQLKWLLGGALSLIALSALFYLEINAWPFLLAGGVLVPAALLWPSLPARVPALLHRLAFPAISVFVAVDYYLHDEILAVLVRLDVLLLLYRSCHYRRRREDLQLIVLGLFLVVMAGVLTVSLAFAVQIVAFVACALLLLFVVTLADVQDGAAAEPVRLGEAPPWAERRWRVLLARVRATCDWRVFALGGALFAGFVTISGVLFMAIPRFELSTGLAFDRLLPRKSTTGFSDTLKFGDVTDIQQDNSVVLRVEASDRAQVPAMLYWRMVVLDEYRNGTFQMSLALKSAAFLRETTVTRIDGTEPLARTRQAQWTFYLEPGVGRYLPLAGGFRRLVFNEPQSVRYAPQLRLVMFGREPSTMKAYRVDRMNTGDRFYAEAPGSESRRERQGLALSEEDQAALRKTMATITGGARLSAEAFTQAATLWLAKQHAYSLKSALPQGKGDPLVRWMTSREPGHCEFFAASFALLARAAGHPVRVVAGYMGGAWNDDYLVVRNSDAHAWCEIYLGGGQWLRVDPTNDGARLLGGGAQATASLREMSSGWSSRLDRLRMLWYRHVVNFDSGEQQQVARRIKESAEQTGRQIREYVAAFLAVAREWLARPWDLGRGARVGGAALLGAAAVFFAMRALRGGWRQWRRARGLALDPVRREAGLWLRRLAASGGECGPRPAVTEDLQRLRYGRRESWPEPRAVFRAAKRGCRGR